MIAFRKILCPVDFSDGSQHALDHAVALARCYGGTVEAVNVVPPVPYADPLMASAIVFTAEDLERTRQDLAAFVTAETGTTPIDSAVVLGDASEMILRRAAELPADLIVMGTHGRRGFERLILGSVTERVLRKASCPVLTVPPRAADAVPVGPVVFVRILCAVDFSPASQKALTYAASLARETNSDLTVMHAVEPVPIYEPVVAGGVGSINYEEIATAAMRARLYEVAPRGSHVRQLVVTGKPYRAILQQAQDDRSDLIVIGAHGGFTDRIGFFGSTTNHIVREATCPVLSLRA